MTFNFSKLLDGDCHHRGTQAVNFALYTFTEGELSTGNYTKPKRGDIHGREGLATLAQFRVHLVCN